MDASYKFVAFSFDFATDKSLRRRVDASLQWVPE